MLTFEPLVDNVIRVSWGTKPCGRLVRFEDGCFYYAPKTGWWPDWVIQEVATYMAQLNALTYEHLASYIPEPLSDQDVQDANDLF